MTEIETIAKAPVTLKRFAWMGISFLMPQVWALGKHQGDFDEGSFRIDDLLQERISCMWKRVKSPDINKFVENQIKDAARGAKKRKIEFHSTRNLRSVSGNGEMFSWESDMVAYNLCIAEPGNRSRLILVRIIEKPGENIRPLVDRLADSLQVDEGQQEFLWCLFGLDIFLPREMIPADFDFRTGSIRLSFERPDERLDLEKLSPANMITGDLSLFDWVQSTKRKQLSRYHFSGDEEQIHGHEGGHFTGKVSKIFARGFKNFQLLFWICEKENRLCSIFHQYRNPDKRQLSYDIDSFRCHRDSAAPETVEAALDEGGKLPAATPVAPTGKNSLTRSQMLSSIPIRNEAVQWTEKDGEVEIQCELKIRFGESIFKKIFGVEKGKKFFLDSIGGFVWRSIDGKRSMKELVDMLAEEYRLEQAEAHAALLVFLRSMMKRRLIGLYVPEDLGSLNEK